jgi:hypothetical protein
MSIEIIGDREASREIDIAGLEMIRETDITGLGTSHGIGIGEVILLLPTKRQRPSSPDSVVRIPLVDLRLGIDIQVVNPPRRVRVTVGVQLLTCSVTVSLVTSQLRRELQFSQFLSVAVREHLRCTLVLPRIYPE